MTLPSHRAAQAHVDILTSVILGVLLVEVAFAFLSASTLRPAVDNWWWLSGRSVGTFKTWYVVAIGAYVAYGILRYMPFFVRQPPTGWWRLVRLLEMAVLTVGLLLLITWGALRVFDLDQVKMNRYHLLLIWVLYGINLGYLVYQNRQSRPG